jgi:xylan 1,4-beta-xylosidase
MRLQLDPSLLRPNLRRPATWSNPVVPGDHPDPTIILAGRTFWASATSGEWSPQFPLFRSDDLVHWTPAGALFLTQPAWAAGSFWAPELVHDEVTGRTLAWYVARRRDNGCLCIAVATADSPAGPYTDHGPLVCEPDGSIDPCFARDEHGQPFLVWKEDGNSQGKPTPIWAQPLSDDLLTLQGKKTQLITNDQPWEEGVVEGPYILRHAAPDGTLWFYLFYAGNSCCGEQCKYAEGVARSRTLLGPWEKFPGNPLIGANDHWRCPGHGTVVHTGAAAGSPRDYLLYHAYPADSSIYVGREALLDEITWPGPPAPDGTPGWPVVNQGGGPGEFRPAKPIDFRDNFAGRQLGPAWQWPVNTHPETITGPDGLRLRIPDQSPLSPRPVESAMIAVPRPASLRYQATVTLVLPQISAHSSASTDAPSETHGSALWAGLAIVGDPFNTAGLGLRGSQLVLWSRRGAWAQTVWQTAAPDGALYLRASSIAPERHLQFSYSTDAVAWHEAGPAIDASDLPAWDRGLRIGLHLEGPRGRSACFRDFDLQAS